MALLSIKGLIWMDGVAENLRDLIAGQKLGLGTEGHDGWEGFLRSDDICLLWEKRMVEGGRRACEVGVEWDENQETRVKQPLCLLSFKKGNNFITQ